MFDLFFLVANLSEDTLLLQVNRLTIQGLRDPELDHLFKTSRSLFVFKTLRSFFGDVRCSGFVAAGADG